MIPHSRPTLGQEEKEAVRQVLDSGQIAQGRMVMEFERNFCDLVRRPFAVAVSSGTSALQLSLLALEISAGDEVILPSFSCVALLHAVDAVGARPVLTDIDPEDFNISVVQAKKKISRRTKAIVVPHAFGRAARMEELLDGRVPIIEDGTQALGARVGQKKVGGFGVLSVFSFYATKMITTGEGGMVLTGSPRLAKRIFDLRDYDKRRAYRFRTNSKMTDLEAAMGIVQIQKLPSFIRRRREIASLYRSVLENSGIGFPSEDQNRDHVYYRYVVRVPKRTRDWLSQMRNQGIDVKEPVFKPLHQYLEIADSRFPETSRAMKEAHSIPLYPSLSDAECSQICDALRMGQLAKPRQERMRPVAI